MKHLNYTILLISLLIFIYPTPLLSETSQKETKKADSDPITIRSNSLEIDNKKKIVTFSGNVDAKTPDFTITCHKMLVFYHDKPSLKDSGKEEIRIEKIIATGDVKINRPDGGLATAEKAVYYQNDEKVVLTGKPVVRQGNDFVEGSKITLFLKEKRSVVEGSEGRKIRAVLFPRSEKR
jgi:lipopolysaccharide export system protein LptA